MPSSLREKREKREKKRNERKERKGMMYRTHMRRNHLIDSGVLRVSLVKK
jgi:hypothetical protein